MNPVGAFFNPTQYIPFHLPSFSGALNCTKAIFRELGALNFRAPYLNIWARNRTFQDYGINPPSVPSSKVHKKAILILHGNGGNHGSSFPLAHYLAKKGNNVFTLSLNYDEPSHIEKINSKLREIHSMYEQHVDVVLVGHSRGGLAALDYQFKPIEKPEDVTIVKTICIATRIHVGEKTTWLPRLWSDIKDLVVQTRSLLIEPAGYHFICASHDWLMRHGADVPPPCFNYQTIPGTSHLSVFFNQTTFETVQAHINS